MLLLKTRGLTTSLAPQGKRSARLQPLLPVFSTNSIAALKPVLMTISSHLARSMAACARADRNTSRSISVNAHSVPCRIHDDRAIRQRGNLLSHVTRSRRIGPSVNVSSAYDFIIFSALVTLYVTALLTYPSLYDELFISPLHGSVCDIFMLKLIFTGVR